MTDSNNGTTAGTNSPQVSGTPADTNTDTRAITKTEAELHNECTTRFVELANTLKNEGTDIRIVNAALMAASGIYATYSSAGNAGALEPTGVDKVVSVYRQNLEHIQKRKKEEIQGA